jgi:hypothetical protein
VVESVLLSVEQTVQFDQATSITGSESVPEFNPGLLAGGAIHRLDLMF